MEEKHFIQLLATEYKQPVFKDFDTTAYFKAFDTHYTKIQGQLKNPKWMAEFYAADSNKLLIVEQQLQSNGLETLCDFLAQSEQHGVRTDYYHLQEIRKALNALKTGTFKSIEEVYPILADLELRSNDGYVAYANMLQYGLLNPKNLFGRYFEQVQRPTFKEAQRIALREDWSFYLDSIQPKTEFYKKFQTALSTANTEAKRQRIYLSMERLRWKQEEFPEKYLFVNIPEQQLRIVEDGAVIEMMRVCVGETDYAPYSKKGDNHQTPILSGIIDRMQVNPVWNIPQSIVNKEILSKLVSNPSYLDNRNMVAYNKKGQLIDPYSVDWSSDTVKSFSFKQNPGSDNSLGNIKFIFKNPYAIYLHDTPSKAAFLAENRAVSHGCVRVEKPVNLASYLVNDTLQAAKIKDEILSDNSKSRWVTMKQGVAVYLTYYTTWFNAAGELTQYPDIYGYDVTLLERLRRYFPKN